MSDAAEMRGFFDDVQLDINLSFLQPFSEQLNTWQPICNVGRAVHHSDGANDTSQSRPRVRLAGGEKLDGRSMEIFEFAWTPIYHCLCVA